MLMSAFFSKVYHFYRTQVSLGSDLWVWFSLTHSKTLCKLYKLYKLYNSSSSWEEVAGSWAGEVLEEGGEVTHSCHGPGLECIPDGVWQAWLRDQNHTTIHTIHTIMIHEILVLKNWKYLYMYISIFPQYCQSTLRFMYI